MSAQRPPIVVVLGHVDHGKTSLIDAIRGSTIATSEVGGITQNIGVSTFTTKEGKKITFIDTPGHASFSQMRSRGSKVADLALLIVAADDGVKPQTKEALDLIKNANIPFLVAVTKVDLPQAEIEKVKNDLEREGLLFEGRGGDIVFIPVSSKTGQGIENLMEMVSLISELQEIKDNEKGDLEAVVIETSKDKRGSLVSCVVRNGVLMVGKIIFADGVSCRVKGLFDSNGKVMDKIAPGLGGQILGFEALPSVGSLISSSDQGKTIEQNYIKQKVISKKIEGIPVLLKARNAGTLEAILSGMPKGIEVVYSSLGAVSESDVFLAKTFSATIFSFETKILNQVRKLSEKEGVNIQNFNVIYELFLSMEDLLKKGQEEILGQAQITALFPFDGKKIAGCKVIQGKIRKVDNLKITRGEKTLGLVKVVSLKKEKQFVEEVKAGQECGILFTPQLEFQVDDVIISVRK